MVIDVPGLKPLIALSDLAGWLVSLKAINQTQVLYDQAWADIELAVRHVGFRRFRKYWRVGRLLVTLPLRLLVEEVLTFMGKPWSNLKTGFDTISQRGEKHVLQKSIKRSKALAAAERTLWKRRKPKRRTRRGGGF